MVLTSLFGRSGAWRDRSMFGLPRLMVASMVTGYEFVNL